MALNAPRLPRLTLPPPLTAAVPGTFAHDTMTRRVVDEIMGREVLDANADALAARPRAKEALKALQRDLESASRTPLRPLLDGWAPDTAYWRAALEPYESDTWLTVPWILAEFYLYRRVMEALSFFPKPQQHGAAGTADATVANDAAGEAAIDKKAGGILDLQTLLSSMAPRLLDGEWVFCCLQQDELDAYPAFAADALMIFKEKEGISLLLPVDVATARNYKFDGIFKGITLDVHSSLEAVGLTAAVSTRMAQEGISANVIAATFHDHVFVGAADAARALAALRGIQAAGGERFFDPFAATKRSGLASAVAPLEQLAPRLLATLDAAATAAPAAAAPATTGAERAGVLALPAAVAEGLRLFTLVSLWGNRMDLSLWPAGSSGDPSAAFAAVLAASGERLVADDGDALAAHCAALRASDGGRVDIIVDNAGFELVMDLCLADFLVTSGVASEVVFRLKGHPTFVSDATAADLLGHVTALAALGANDADLDAGLDAGLDEELGVGAEQQHRPGPSPSVPVPELELKLPTDPRPGCVRLARRWKGHLAARRWRLAEDLFWAQPAALWELPPRLAADFAGEDLLPNADDDGKPDGKLEGTHRRTTTTTAAAAAATTTTNTTNTTNTTSDTGGAITNRRPCALALTKGDANYRRLLGDRAWPLDVPFAEVVSYFPAPLCALRTLKSEIGCGVAVEASVRAAAEDPRWMLSGRYGVIQFAPAMGAGGQFS